MLSSNIVNLDGTALASSTTVRNLGVIFDQKLSFNWYVKQISRTVFFHLRNIAKIWHILSQEDAEKLVNAFVTSRLDNCNSLFSGCLNKILRTLQLTKNAAAHILTRFNIRDHISPTLASLLCPPVKFRIEFKILVLTNKAIHGQSPSYERAQSTVLPIQNCMLQGCRILVSPRKVERKVFQKTNVKAELSAIKLLSCRTISQSWYGTQTHSLILRVGLNLHFW